MIVAQAADTVEVDMVEEDTIVAEEEEATAQVTVVDTAAEEVTIDLPLVARLALVTGSLFMAFPRALAGR